MKKLIALLPAIICCICSIAQSTTFLISGKVIDAATKAPLQGASVFAQHTTIGTATDAEGNFTLRLPNGGYDLVITFTGYETGIKRIGAIDESNKNIAIDIKPKEKAMEEVAIKTTNEVKDGWLKYGDFFIENFIGKSNNGKLCTIKNPTALKFFFSKKRNRLKVIATEPVEIDNPALGYKIKYTLDSFTHEYATQTSLFTGYPLFEEMQTLDTAQIFLWQANRQKAYQGSILHFMRSVYNKTLQEEGFEIQFIAKENGIDKAIQLKDFYGALNYSKDDSTQLVDIVPNQPEMAVIYKNEEPEQAYNLQNEEAPKKFELSVVTIPTTQSIGIEQNGFYFDQNDITINGYWTWEKAGDMIPYDYKNK